MRREALTAFDKNSSFSAKIGFYDELGSIHIDRTCWSGRIVSIGWAVLTVDDRIANGTIDLAWHSVDPDAVHGSPETIMYRSAALALNQCLRFAIVRLAHTAGKNAEDHLYDVAGVRPSWRSAGRSLLTAYDELAIELEDGLGFRPYLPVPSDGAPCDRAADEMKAYRALRMFAREAQRHMFGRSDAAPAFANIVRELNVIRLD